MWERRLTLLQHCNITKFFLPVCLPMQTARHRWQTCASDSSDRIWDLYLGKRAPSDAAEGPSANLGDHYVLQVLGRAGEAPPDPKTVMVQVRSQINPVFENTRHLGGLCAC